MSYPYPQYRYKIRADGSLVNYGTQQPVLATLNLDLDREVLVFSDNNLSRNIIIGSINYNKLFHSANSTYYLQDQHGYNKYNFSRPFPRQTQLTPRIDPHGGGLFFVGNQVMGSLISPSVVAPQPAGASNPQAAGASNPQAAGASNPQVVLVDRIVEVEKIVHVDNQEIIQKLEAAQAQVQELEASRGETQRETDQLRGERDALARAKEVENSRVRELEADLAAALTQAQIAEAQAREREALAQERSELEAALAAQRAEAGRLLSELEVAQSALNAQAQEAQGETDKLRGELATEREALAAAQAALAAQRAEAGRREADLAAEREAALAAQAEAQAALAQVAQLEAALVKVAQLEATRSELAEELADSKVQVTIREAALAAECEALADEREAHAATKAALADRARELEAALATQAAQREELEAARRDLVAQESQLEAALGETDQLRHQLATVAKANQDEREAAQRERDELATQAALAAKAQELEATRSDLAAQLEAALAPQVAILEAALAQVQELEASLTAREAALTTAQAQVRDHKAPQSEIERLQREVERLQAQLVTQAQQHASQIQEAKTLQRKSDSNSHYNARSRSHGDGNSKLPSSDPQQTSAKSLVKYRYEYLKKGEGEDFKEYIKVTYLGDGYYKNKYVEFSISPANQKYHNKIDGRRDKYLIVRDIFQEKINKFNKQRLQPNQRDILQFFSFERLPIKSLDHTSLELLTAIIKAKRPQTQDRGRDADGARAR